jgi:hypothetical protein
MGTALVFSAIRIGSSSPPFLEGETAKAEADAGALTDIEGLLPLGALGGCAEAVAGAG